MRGDLTLGPLHVQGAAATLARAAEKLGVPVPQSDPDSLMIGPFRLRCLDGRVEIMNDGEGGWFDADELSVVVGQFVSDRM